MLSLFPRGAACAALVALLAGVGHFGGAASAQTMHHGHATAPSGRPAEAAPAATAPARIGPLMIEGAWSREPQPGSRVSGGYLKVTNTGSSADRLVSASVGFAKRVELHEMAVVDGVMRMRELAKGIEIAPGTTVELKPGGLHLMFMDISERPRAGQPVTATLVFEKAGKVEVTFTVQPAASAPRGGGHKHH
jgi:copper(I)-binding protein